MYSKTTTTKKQKQN